MNHDIIRFYFNDIHPNVIFIGLKLKNMLLKLMKFNFQKKKKKCLMFLCLHVFLLNSFYATGNKHFTSFNTNAERFSIVFKT